MVKGPPQWWIETKLEASKSEKYPEDWINEKGTSASITKTMNKRESELKWSIDDIIDIAENI